MSAQIELRKTMSKSAKVLIARQSTIQLFSVFASVILARLLTPQDFGLYAIIGFFLQFLTLISDGGIGASLIQRDSEPDSDTYAVAFTLVQILYLGTCIVAIPGAMVFIHFYNSMSLNGWMVYTFILEFYLSSFRVIPAAKLERALKYSRLAAVEILEYFSFQAVAVVLAFMRDGVWSFIFGALASRVVGLVILYILSPVAPSLRFDGSIARPLMRFGIALQLADIIGFVQSSLSPSFIAFRLGTAAVGLLNFARKVGSYPTYPLNVVNRMMFPLLSRLQYNDSEFERTLNDTIRIYNILLFGTTSVLLGVVPEAIQVIFGDKWIRSTELVYSVLLGTLLWGYTNPISAAIQAKGRGKVFLVTNGLRAVIAWIITVPSVILFGYNGLITLNVSGVLTFPVLFTIVRKYVRVRFWSNFWRPACSLAITFCVQRTIVGSIQPHSVLALSACFTIGALVYIAVTLILDQKTRAWVFVHANVLSRGRRWLGNRERQEI